MEETDETHFENMLERMGKSHHGRSITRIRNEKGIKQEALALDLNISQQTVSRLEKKRLIDDKTLAKVAKALDVSIERIKEVEEENPMTIIVENNNFHDNAGNVSATLIEGDQITNNNPIDEILELHKKNEELQERLLKAEQDKIAYLEKLIKKYE